jgi:hypothetical protein
MMTEAVIEIPKGTSVSFVDPITMKPVRGVVKLEGKEIVGVSYRCTRKSKSADGKNEVEKVILCWINIRKDKVFVIR